MLKIEPITPHIGARIHELDLSTCSADELDKVYQALITHQVIFLDGQTLSPEQHLMIAQRFGTLEPVHPFFPRVESAPQVSVIETTRGNAPMESYWHTDLTWRRLPSKASLLHAQHIPSVGGDTIWCSMTAVFESLNEGIKAKLRGLSATHSLVVFEGIKSEDIELDWHKSLIKTAQENPPVVHSVVQVHPETGKETLYINEQFTRHINELDRKESDVLLSQLFEIARRPEFQVRFKWDNGSMAIWDNRVTQHYAVIDYGDTPRKMHRVTVT
ncbi:TauD/TfdA dioxygenase family protein [Vibrio celticus]|uniref:Alpha-ketoglutarate-dependent taurine dioxygenase n=1 Tax=Vibrio celticus TaxID=446372 RepID=A0A1C3JGM3_9VIBR|nr:TauD/TfdA family dioxygenase [Vibrio celticus]SBT14299.1 Alpha-ketoglutarate-dependent taurine dioxygenase [Vibrio celticus]